MSRTDGEKIVEVQTQMIDVNRRLGNIEISVGNIEKKVDDLVLGVSEKYISTATFIAYKEAQDKEKQNLMAQIKNQNLEKVIWILVTAILTGAVSLFFRNFGV